jgi:hypothetical protein
MLERKDKEVIGRKCLWRVVGRKSELDSFMGLVHND